MRKKEFLSFSTMWMDSDHIMLSEISHTEKDKCWMATPSCEIQVKLVFKKNSKMVVTSRYGARGIRLMVFKSTNKKIQKYLVLVK